MVESSSSLVPSGPPVAVGVLSPLLPGLLSAASPLPASCLSRSRCHASWTWCWYVHSVSAFCSQMVACESTPLSLLFEFESGSWLLGTGTCALRAAASKLGIRWISTVQVPMVSPNTPLLKKGPATLSVSRMVLPQDVHLGGTEHWHRHVSIRVGYLSPVSELEGICPISVSQGSRYGSPRPGVSSSGFVSLFSFLVAISSLGSVHSLRLSSFLSYSF